MCSFYCILVVYTQQECRQMVDTDGRTHPRQICTFDSPLEGCKCVKVYSIAGKLFRTFTILFAKEFVLALLVYCDLYSLYA